jgi:hypothetical protein
VLKSGPKLSRPQSFWEANTWAKTFGHLTESQKYIYDYLVFLIFNQVTINGVFDKKSNYMYIVLIVFKSSFQSSGIRTSNHLSSNQRIENYIKMICFNILFPLKLIIWTRPLPSTFRLLKIFRHNKKQNQFAIQKKIAAVTMTYSSY